MDDNYGMSVPLNEASPQQRKEAIEGAVHTILVAIGEDPECEGLRGTPERVARMFLEEVASQDLDEASIIRGIFHEERFDHMIIVKNIPVKAWCQHHLVPFYGKAHIGYIMKDKVLGLSKLARIVYAACSGPTIQERVAEEVADALEQFTDPLGVMVVIEAVHMCMLHRGVKAEDASAIVSVARGVFRDKPETRAEFLSLIR